PPDAPAAESPPATFRERLETASEVWRLRADLARQRLFDRVQPEPDQAARFDVLMEAMNLRLGAAIDDWAARIAAADEVTPAMGVRMMHEITGVLALTYDELDRTLPPAWQANDDGSFELVTFIDPEVAMPLIAVEDTLRASRPARRGPFGPPPRP
ncbi:MAG: hypothetical protein K9N49_10635, partial [Candidatus Marinimicrobia bacterium]|nr:hypothetical protein [Candidatus Neomarinimicrobiota bacterium]